MKQLVILFLSVYLVMPSLAQKYYSGDVFPDFHVEDIFGQPFDLYKNLDMGWLDAIDSGEPCQ